MKIKDFSYKEAFYTKMESWINDLLYDGFFENYTSENRSNYINDLIRVWINSCMDTYDYCNYMDSYNVLHRLCADENTVNEAICYFEKKNGRITISLDSYDWQDFIQEIVDRYLFEVFFEDNCDTILRVMEDNEIIGLTA